MKNQFENQLRIKISWADNQPDRYTLSHLFDLCSNFTPLPENLFQRKTDLDKDEFKVLATGARNVRYRAGFSPDPTETRVLHQRLELLIKESC